MKKIDEQNLPQIKLPLQGYFTRDFENFDGNSVSGMFSPECNATSLVADHQVGFMRGICSDSIVEGWSINCL